MKDRHAGYVVTLADDVREDDAEEGVLNAIRMIRGVASVRPVESSPEIDIATSRAERKWRQGLISLMEGMRDA